MSKKSRKRDSRAVLLVDANQEQVTRLRKKMPEWLLFGENGHSDLSPKPAGRSIDAVIVFARKNGKKRVLDVCAKISEKKEMKDVPLFVAGSRYQMDLAHAVKRLPRGDFLFTPIRKDKLLDKMKKKVNASS
jgi:response regulator RpfG family c-di-GMP phosphodiesterase